MGEHSGSILSYILQPRTPTSLGMPDLMDEDEGLEETEESPKDPVPESGPLSEIREVMHWPNNPVLISELSWPLPSLFP